MTGHEVVVDVDLGFGEQALGLADFIRGPAVEALGQFAGSHRGVETEPLPQFPAGALASFIQGEKRKTGLYAVLGKDRCCLERAVQTSLGDLVVLADVDRLYVAKARQQPLPIRLADTDGHRRHCREAMFHKRDAVGHALGDDQPLRVGEQTVLVVKVAVVDARGDVLAGVFVVDRELLVFSLLPWLVRRPGCLASDHENDAAAAPVGKHDAPVEERIESVLVGGTERAGCRQIPRGETALLAGQLPDDSLVAVVVRIADEEPVDRLHGKAVL